jgi:hypothetical protein
LQVASGMLWGPFSPFLSRLWGDDGSLDVKLNERGLIGPHRELNPWP